MKFIETSLNGAYLIEYEPIEDNRGFFARTWCKQEFVKYGLNPNLVQCNISYNNKKGTLRGMHYQEKPYQEAKLVRCIKGAIFDVIIDLRPQSKTFKSWLGIELTAANRKMLYVPEGFAHGFVTLQDNTEVFYQMSEFYNQECSKGVRWNDKAFNIKWPEVSNITISDKDQGYEDFPL